MKNTTHTHTMIHACMHTINPHIIKQQPRELMKNWHTLISFYAFLFVTAIILKYIEREFLERDHSFMTGWGACVNVSIE